MCESLISYFSGIICLISLLPFYNIFLKDYNLLHRSFSKMSVHFPKYLESPDVLNFLNTSIYTTYFLKDVQWTNMERSPFLTNYNCYFY